MYMLKTLVALLVFCLGFTLGFIYRMRWVLLIAALIYIVVQVTN